MQETERQKLYLLNQRKSGIREKPAVSAAILILIKIGLPSSCAELIMIKDPTYMDLLNYNKVLIIEFFKQILWEGIFFP